jgi:orotidine-5'-phosphate decarboxylase
MLTAAVMEANEFAADHAPLLIGVSVLTSLDERTLQDRLGVARGLNEHMIALSKLGVECGLDGVVCSVHEVADVRKVVGHAIIVTPGIRPVNYDTHDQMRVGGAVAALESGSDYLVIGRVLTEAADPQVALHDLGLLQDEAVS